MQTRYKTIIILFMLILFTSFYGMAYSFFNSDAILDSDDLNVAKFIFNTESLDEFQLSLTDLKPGDDKQYLFSVSNNNLQTASDITLEYQIIIKTYHLIPLVIELYKINSENEELIITCDETYTRNHENELVCATLVQELGHSSLNFDDYKLRVNFPTEHDDVSYSNLVDYVNIEIKSWQKLKD